MTRLRQIAMAGLAAIAIGGVASSASAMESGTFQNRLNGATIGLPLGAAPPPGLYTGLETAYLGMTAGNTTNGRAAGNYGSAVLPAIAQAVPLLWVPGWNFLGATYSASVVEAFYTFVACGGATSNGANCGGAAPISGGGFVYTNTYFQPIALSWNVGSGWFISAGFAFTAPTGTRQSGTPNPDYWTFEPSLAFSYLGNNWVASANFFYDVNTKSDGVCCTPGTSITSGNALYGDLTAVYKIGKWSVGPVGYFEVQTTNDTGTCSVTTTTPTVVTTTTPPGTTVTRAGATTTSSVCGRYETAAAGALVGYDFGPVDLQLWVTDSFVGQNTPQGVGGLNVWSRIGFKIWGPDAPHPLVTKN